MQRYFVKEFDYDEKLKHYTDILTLSSRDSHHLKNVMRKKVDDEIEVVLDENIFICKIININENVKCQIIRKIEKEEDNIPSITIAQSLVKEQKMDYILQKSCELGVNQIIPLSTYRSIIKIDKKENKKIERWQSILNSASEQSKRTNCPNVLPIMNIDELCNLDYDYKLLCSVNQKSINIKNVLSNVSISDTILVVVGPEGGFTLEEEEKLINFGFTSISLGNRVLRTESVSLFILSIFNYIFMR